MQLTGEMPDVTRMAESKEERLHGKKASFVLEAIRPDLRSIADEPPLPEREHSSTTRWRVPPVLRCQTPYALRCAALRSTARTGPDRQ